MAKIEIVNYPLYQWDKDRIVKVVLEGEESLERIDFANYQSEEGPSIFVNTDNNNEIFCKIPNELLQKNGGLKIYAVTIKEETRTFCEATFSILRRSKPSDYIYEEKDILSFKDLDNKIGSLMQLETEDKSDIVKAVNELSQALKNFISVVPQKFSEEQKAQARENIGAEIATDDEIMEMLTQEDMLPAIVDSDGSLLADENGNILLW
jgi:hypothetical protein